MSTFKKIPNYLVGIAGEYAVAAELSKRGWVTTLTLKNTRGIDILITDLDSIKNYSIQVKTNQKSSKKWVIGEKVETTSSKNLIYIFVNLNNESGHAEFHIIPSQILSKKVKKEHSDWLNKPSKKGKPHKDNPVRVFKDLNNEYLNRWDFIE